MPSPVQLLKKVSLDMGHVDSRYFSEADEVIVAKQSLVSILSVSIEIYAEKCDIAFCVADENPKKQSRHDTTRLEFSH